MLDAFKNLTRGKDAQKQSDELEALITAAREERNALSAMLTTLTMRAGKLTPLSKSLDHSTERAAAISRLNASPTGNRIPVATTSRVLKSGDTRRIAPASSVSLYCGLPSLSFRNGSAKLYVPRPK